ncbi:MAG TPA: response regulator [Candidatus Saccharicenans sp.]|jgi:CheY-like chemotaxis protein|nr:response regulator [Candidatus Saccharicenans sp.]HQE65108.1 response regulator [Candidatus Saccharicenans sp.]HQH60848.1 response regulator [Candidatus Saccharicenans sp.]HQI23136.1 response regulator [Candidatus Saccharicenans sp.]
MTMARILLVDDDRDLTGTLSQILSLKGYEVVVAYSGAEGLKKLLETKPDLVIMDVMMETDTAGFEAIYKIRSDRPDSRFKDFKDIPIIILTAIDQVTNSRFSLDQEESFLPGRNEFLNKPVDPDELLEKIEKNLKK